MIRPARADSPGTFEVARASARTAGSDLLVDALVDLSLGTEAQQALQSGVTLTIQFQFEIIRLRTFWTNEVVLERQHTIELRYMLLSQRYAVTYPDSETQSSYATLYSALRQIGLLRDFPLASVEQISADDNYKVGMRAVLVQENLPGPLQMLAFWRDDFSLESEWYWWNLSK